MKSSNKKKDNSYFNFFFSHQWWTKSFHKPDLIPNIQKKISGLWYPASNLIPEIQDKILSVKCLFENGKDSSIFRFTWKHTFTSKNFFQDIHRSPAWRVEWGTMGQVKYFCASNLYTSQALHTKLLQIHRTRWKRIIYWLFSINLRYRSVGIRVSGRIEL